MEGGVGLAGAGGHHQQHTILPARHGLDRAVDGVHLVIARHAAGAVVVVRRGDLVLGLVIQTFPFAVALPEFIRAGELVEAQFGFDLRTSAAAVMEQKTIAIAGEHEGHIQRLGITQGLLHAGANGVLVVLRLNHGDGQVLLVAEDVVGALVFATAVQLAADDDAAFGKAKFFEHLLVHVPAGLLDSGGDVLAANVPFGKRLFVHNPNSLSSRPGRSMPALLMVRDGRKCTLFALGCGSGRGGGLKPRTVAGTLGALSGCAAPVPFNCWSLVCRTLSLR